MDHRTRQRIFDRLRKLERRGLTRSIGTVYSTSPFRVKIAGVVIDDVKVLSSYTPAAGDRVFVSRSGHDLVVHGAMAGDGPGGVPDGGGGGVVVFPEDYGVVGDGVTDDTDALQDAIDAALAVGGTLKLAAKTYLVNQAPRTDREGHCILSILDERNSMKRITIEGSGNSASVDAAYLDLAIPTDRTIIKTTRTTDSYSATYGPPSVIGGGTEEQGAIDTLAGHGTEWCGPVTLRNFAVQVPLDPAIAGIDMLTFGGCDRENVSVFAGTGGDATSLPTNAHAFGFRWPARWANGVNHDKRGQALQMYVGHVFWHTDHAFLDATLAFRCYIGFAFQDGGDGLYPIVGRYAMAEACPYTIAGWDPSSGLIDVPHEVFMNLTVQTEAGGSPFVLTNLVKDASNLLRGRIDLHYFNGLGVSDGIPTSSGGTKLDIRLPRQPALATRRNSAPADGETPTSGLAFWHDDTAGAHKIMAKGKDSGGTVWSATVAEERDLGSYWFHPIIAAASAAVSFANIHVFGEIKIHEPTTLTGVGYWVGGTSNGNVRSALFNSAGTRVANRTTNLTQATANTFQKVAFDSTLAVRPGIYYAAIIFSSATATHFSGKGLAPSSATIEAGFATPSSITPPTAPASGGCGAYTVY